MSRQSSVGWLVECLSIHLTEEQKTQFEGLFQQTQQMNRDEIEEAFDKGKWDSLAFKGTPKEQYYNETYGK
jgi:hypothetical protein